MWLRDDLNARKQENLRPYRMKWDWIGLDWITVKLGYCEIRKKMFILPNIFYILTSIIRL